MPASFVSLLVVVPLVLAPVCLVLRRPAAAFIVALLGSLFVLFAALQLLLTNLDGTILTHAFGGWQPPWGISYRIGTAHAWIALLLGLIFTPVLLFARTSIEQEALGARHDVFFALCLLLLGGLLGVTVSDDLFNIYVFLEIASLSGYALVAFTHNKASALCAFRYLVIGAIGSTLFLLGIGFLYFLTGTLNLSDMKILFPGIQSTQTAYAGLMLLSTGLFLKAAIFPLHQWLPGAYTHAPIVVSALLSATSTKIAVFLWARLFFGVFDLPTLLENIPLDTFLMLLAAAGIIFGSTMAIRQNNVKTLLAYSSISQIGYIFLGFVVPSSSGIRAGFIYLWNHAFIKAGLFLFLACAVFHCKNASIEALKGLHQRAPLLALMISVGGLSLIGVPLTNGFISKWYLVSALWEAQQMWLLVVVLLGSLLSVVYVWRLIEAMYFHNNEQGSPVALPITLLLPVLFFLTTLLYFGIQPGAVIEISNMIATSFLAS